jgi:hypothetical protein
MNKLLFIILFLPIFTLVAQNVPSIKLLQDYNTSLDTLALNSRNVMYIGQSGDHTYTAYLPGTAFADFVEFSNDSVMERHFAHQNCVNRVSYSMAAFDPYQFSNYLYYTKVSGDKHYLTRYHFKDRREERLDFVISSTHYSSFGYLGQTRNFIYFISQGKVIKVNDKNFSIFNTIGNGAEAVVVDSGLVYSSPDNSIFFAPDFGRSQVLLPHARRSAKLGGQRYKDFTNNQLLIAFPFFYETPVLYRFNMTTNQADSIFLPDEKGYSVRLLSKSNDTTYFFQKKSSTSGMFLCKETGGVLVKSESITPDNFYVSYPNHTGAEAIVAGKDSVVFINQLGDTYYYFYSVNYKTGKVKLLEQLIVPLGQMTIHHVPNRNQIVYSYFKNNVSHGFVYKLQEDGSITKTRIYSTEGKPFYHNFYHNWYEDKFYYGYHKNGFLEYHQINLNGQSKLAFRNKLPGKGSNFSFLHKDEKFVLMTDNGSGLYKLTDAGISTLTTPENQLYIYSKLEGTEKRLFLARYQGKLCMVTLTDMGDVEAVYENSDLATFPFANVVKIYKDTAISNQAMFTSGDKVLLIDLESKQTLGKMTSLFSVAPSTAAYHKSDLIYTVTIVNQVYEMNFSSGAIISKSVRYTSAYPYPFSIILTSGNNLLEYHPKTEALTSLNIGAPTIYNFTRNSILASTTLGNGIFDLRTRKFYLLEYLKDNTFWSLSINDRFYLFRNTTGRVNSGSPVATSDTTFLFYEAYVDNSRLVVNVLDHETGNFNSNPVRSTGGFYTYNEYSGNIYYQKFNLNECKEQFYSYHIPTGGQPKLLAKADIDSIRGFEGLAQTEKRVYVKANGLSTGMEIHYFNTTPDVITDFDTQVSIANNKELIVYPNPAGDDIRIFEQQGWKFKYVILDVTGKIQKQGVIGEDGHIRISELPDGYYIIKLSGKGEDKISAFIKN